MKRLLACAIVFVFLVCNITETFAREDKQLYVLTDETVSIDKEVKNEVGKLLGHILTILKLFLRLILVEV